MYRSWRSIAAVAISLALAGTNAQSMPDLGTVLANQSDLTTFNGLIQVCGCRLTFLAAND
jgi:hypothetical protein